jgi:hypothetical protein
MRSAYVCIAIVTLAEAPLGLRETQSGPPRRRHRSDIGSQPSRICPPMSRGTKSRSMALAGSNSLRALAELQALSLPTLPPWSPGGTWPGRPLRLLIQGPGNTSDQKTLG